MDGASFIEQVQEIGALPDGRFTIADLLQLSNGEMGSTVQKLLSCREDYLVESMTLSLGQLQGLGFRIPSYFVGNKIRKIDALDSTGDHVPVARITLDELEERVPGYLMKGGRIQSLGLDRYGQSFILYYHGRPGVVETFNSNDDTTFTSWTPPITAVNGAVLTSPTLGSLFTKASLAYVDGPVSNIDIYKSDGGNEYVARNLTCTLNSLTNELTLPDTAANLGIEVGDFIAWNGQSCHINLPEEFARVHVQRTVCKALEALGDTASLQIAQQKLTEIEKLAVDMMSQRDDGKAKRVTIAHDNPFRAFKRRWR